YEFDIFVSYSRSDVAFVRRLEEALEAFAPPSGLELPDRRLNVFRDTSDMTGTDYFNAIAEHLSASRVLLVICSPAARASAYVNDEIKRFVSVRGSEHIVPILLSGIPNNEARDDRGDLWAFPDALCEALEMPLAISYRAFDPDAQRPDEEPFLDSWYSLLANVY